MPHCFEDDPGPGTELRADRAELADDLEHLFHLRTAHRFARGVITKSWFMAGVLFVLALTAWWTIIPAAGFTLIAAHFAATTDWKAGRGRELDADIAAAKGRLQGGAS